MRGLVLILLAIHMVLSLRSGSQRHYGHGPGWYGHNRARDDGGSKYIFGKKCSAICGITDDIPSNEEANRRNKRSAMVNKDDDTPANEDDYADEDQVEDDDTRIVNGYSASARPWLVLILPYQGICGGALINAKFVLSAAHCYCRMDKTMIKCEKAMVDGVPTSKPSYDVSKHIEYIVGINDKDFFEAKQDPKMVFRAVKVNIREGWVFGETMNPDISLAELNRRVNFVPNVVAPVCIPTVEDTMRAFENHVKMFVAGWGAQFSACDTSDIGPSPNMMCKFPFIYNGKKYDSCITEPTPAASNPVCSSFFKWAQKNGIELKFGHNKKAPKAYPISVEVPGKKGKFVRCFTPKPGHLGWCGACYQDTSSHRANEGKEGYCDYMNPTRQSKPGEESVVSVDKNWGHCADWCSDKASQAPSNKLMETGLNVLHVDICEDFGAKLHFNRTSEFCTGNKKSFPKIDVFRATGPHSWDGKRISTEKYGLNLDSKYDFYLGGSDSCQGDSGGPIIAFMKFKDGTNRGFTMGAVSRGTGCANLNAPGIFSMVSKHLHWLKKRASTQDSSC